MRVLTLIDALRMGGAETLLAPLARAARAGDVELDVVGVSPAAENSAKTLRVLREAGVQPRSLRVRRLLDPTAIPQLVGEIRRSGADVVHAHLEMAMTLAVPAGALARRPVVCTFHHVARPLTGRAAWRERLAVEAATRSERALFVSDASRAAFRDRYRPAGAPANWEVVHNGVDLATFAAGPADPAVRRELGGGPGPLVVLPAAFRDFKGIPVALRAWPAVRERVPDAVLALVGGGELEPELRVAAAAAGLAPDAVVFAGVRTDMPAVFRAADLVLLPSTHGENLPTVLIEAAGSGRAVVASRIGGVPDIVADGETGLLVPAGQPAALADAVVALLEDPARRGRFQTAAVRRAHALFSAESWLRRLVPIYRAAIDRRPAPAAVG